MSLAEQAVTAILALAALGAAASLWLGAPDRHGPGRRACRWFTAAALLWGTAAVLEQMVTIPVASSAIPLSFADLPALLALPVLAAGLIGLAAAGREGAPPAAPPGRGGPGAWVADGYVFAAALFLIGWVALFDSAFVRAAVGAGTFAVELTHPLADIVVLGAALPVVGRGGRRAVVAYLALLAMTVSDSLAVGARVTGTRPGVAATLAALAAFALLGLVPWPGAWAFGPGKAWWRARLPAGGSVRAVVSHHGPPRAIAAAGPAGVVPGERDGTGGSAQGGHATTVAAAAVAGVAALAICLRALVGGHLAWPLVAALAGTMAAVLALRILGLVRRENAATRIWRDQTWQFRQLADRTSDVILLCDLDGAIKYASRAVAGYGYTPDDLRGRTLAELLHPEDRTGGSWAVRKAVADATGRAGRYPCRVRAADGTWRHVESTVSRYHEPAGAERLLVTARDVSDQVALRRQVTHLTFYDGLTGLPNRAYVEQRARGVLAHGVQAGQQDPGRSRAPVTGVIFLDLDGFTAVNAAAGHSAGDLLLAQVAHRLRATVPAQDTVARWGGDEFAVLIEGAVSAEEIVDIAGGLARAVASAPFRAGERDVCLTASVGVALSDDGPAGVWRNADMAVSRAKESGGARVEVFVPPGADDGMGGGTAAAPGGDLGRAPGGAATGGPGDGPESARERAGGAAVAGHHPATG